LWSVDALLLLAAAGTGSEGARAILLPISHKDAQLSHPGPGHVNGDFSVSDS
jgi:hypothetical protein